MNKFKIEKGISRITRVKLQATIEEAIAADLALLGEWSNNDKNYIVNELLRFALSQDSEFQAYKESIGSSRPEPILLSMELIGDPGVQADRTAQHTEDLSVARGGSVDFSVLQVPAPSHWATELSYGHCGSWACHRNF
jgi:hypothetical protein